MSNMQLVQKIESLPEMLQLQVADFVDFLLNKHYQEKPAPTDNSDLTEEQKAELDKRYKAYLENPDSVVKYEAVKTRSMKKYGLSTSN